MAVIQISKIQVRSGLQENLPQLATAEFGWSVDQRRLYIGNGTLGEGAPSIGNTEILTQYTDIVNVIKSYYFIGDESNYTSEGAVLRTLQHKLDERVTVKDFGAVGDGIADDTTAIQAAILQIYPRAQNSNVRVRRVLYFPAGTYLISSELAIPSYVKLVGEGVDSTFITQTGSVRSIFTFSDSNREVSPNLGDSSALFPQSISISEMTLYNTTDNDVVYLDSSSLVKFSGVKFVGSQTSPTTAGTSTALVRMISVDATTSSISFDNCIFNNASYALVLNDDVYSVSVSNCVFDNIYLAIKASGSVVSPRNIKVTGCAFANIANYAISSLNSSNIISAFNNYISVGNGLSTSPVSSVIYYTNANNYSFGDYFARSDSDAKIWPRINADISVAPSSKVTNSIGSLTASTGMVDTILSNVTLSNTSCSIYSVNASNAFIDYNLTRNGNVRTGTLKLSVSSTNSFYYEDDFVENPVSSQFSYGLNSPVGTQLLFVAYGNNIVLVANTSSTGGNVTLKYNIRNFS